jgi:pyruvate dehydrogenase E1 component beta subunit
MFVDFVGVCLDQILNQAAKFRYMFGGKAETPVVIRTMYGAGLRAASQHSQCLYSIFAHIPGLKCAVPATAYDAKGLFVSAIRDNDPVIFMEHKALYNQVSDDVPAELYSIPFGEARIVREGRHVTIVAIGRMVHFAEQAARDLDKEKISCEVIDPRTISPLDEDTILESVQKTGRLVVVDESTPMCNMATHIAAIVADKAFSSLKAPIRRVTAPHTPPPFAPELEDLFVPSPQRIAEAVRSIA